MGQGRYGDSKQHPPYLTTLALKLQKFSIKGFHSFDIDCRMILDYYWQLIMGGLMKKLISLLLIMSFLGLHCAKYEKGEGINLLPNQKPGIKLVVQKTDGQFIEGELITLRENLLLLKESRSGADYTIAVSDIKIITVMEYKVGKGALYGFGLAAAGAGLYGLSLDPEETEMTRVNNVIFCVIVFGGMGALAGAIVGGFLSKSKTIQIEGKSEAEINEVLEELRKKARVPDFQ